MDASVLWGSWELKKFVRRRGGEEITSGYGDNPQGRILYMRNGYMSSIMTRGNRPPVPPKSFANLTEEERLAVASPFVSYAGKFRVEGNKVIHSVEVSFLPWMIGKDVVRFINLHEPIVTLTTEPFALNGDTVVDELDWKRLKAEP